MLVRHARVALRAATAACRTYSSRRFTYGGISTYLLENLEVSLLRNDKRLAFMAPVSRVSSDSTPPWPLYPPPVTRRSRMGPPCTVLRPGIFRVNCDPFAEPIVLIPDCLSAGAVLQTRQWGCQEHIAINFKQCTHVGRERGSAGSFTGGRSPRVVMLADLLWLRRLRVPDVVCGRSLDVDEELGKLLK